VTARVPHPPIEPRQTRVRFPDPLEAPSHGVLAVGCDFTPGTLLLAYRSGIFPWPHGDEPDGKSGARNERGTPLVLWFSPEPRCIFELENEPHWSRSLRRTLRTHPYEVTVDQDFAGVMHMCGETRKNATWIIPELEHGYRELHRLGWAHSVEVWETSGDRRELVGGIYGVAIGGLFAGESMFHTRTDASKIAFAMLVSRLREAGFVLFDVQVSNPHLASLGCIEIPRREYLERLRTALSRSPRPLL
jgi:leucyl/phenylalanyl-tRNA--protein transferase